MKRSIRQGTTGSVAQSVLKRLVISLLAMLRSVLLVGVIQQFQAFAEGHSAGVRYRTFGDETASQRDMSGELAGERAPPEGTCDERGDGGLLLGESNRLAARRRNHKCHADLVSGEECGVGSELTDRPRQLEHAGDDIRQCCCNGE